LTHLPTIVSCNPRAVRKTGLEHASKLTTHEEPVRVEVQYGELWVFLYTYYLILDVI
jgi:hypothetical protein